MLLKRRLSRLSRSHPLLLYVFMIVTGITEAEPPWLGVDTIESTTFPNLTQGWKEGSMISFKT